jgi:hypothetical protein
LARKRSTQKPDEGVTPDLRVMIPDLKIDEPHGITWEYSLDPEGFKVYVKCDFSGKTVTLSNTMSWDVFIHGLATGWKEYHQDNPEFTRLINEFIQEQVVEGNYVPVSSPKEGTNA